MLCVASSELETLRGVSVAFSTPRCAWGNTQGSLSSCSEGNWIELVNRVINILRLKEILKWAVKMHHCSRNTTWKPWTYRILAGDVKGRFMIWGNSVSFSILTAKQDFDRNFLDHWELHGDSRLRSAEGGGWFGHYLAGSVRPLKPLPCYLLKSFCCRISKKAVEKDGASRSSLPCTSVMQR